MLSCAGDGCRWAHWKKHRPDCKPKALRQQEAAQRGAKAAAAAQRGTSGAGSVWRWCVGHLLLFQTLFSSLFKHDTGLTLLCCQVKAGCAQHSQDSFENPQMCTQCEPVCLYQFQKAAALNILHISHTLLQQDY